MMDYVKDNSLELVGVYYDFYLNNPADTPENELLTKLVFPLK
jgi:effector-binding domain-containing protein